MKQLVSKARILIVEDEVLIAEEIRDRLARLEYEVVGHSVSSEDAVASAIRHRPDLVLMDIRLQGRGDGIEAGTRIMRDVGVPIVYLTAHSDEPTLVRAKASKPFGFVLKPFQQKDLVVAIEMALQRHAVERRLHESEQRFATTLESIGDAVVATDQRGRVTFMNPTAERMTGWTFAEVDGIPIEEVLCFNEDGSPAQHPIDEAIRSRSTVHLHTIAGLRHRAGQVTPIEDCASPILAETGEVLGAVMAFRDCSERLATQEALANAQRSLHEARRLEALGRLAAGVAHDFNNVLMLLVGSAELLRPSVALDPGASALLDSILKAAERGTALTNQLLAYGREGMAVPRVVDLNELLRKLASQLDQQVGPAVSVQPRFAEEPLPICIDHLRLEQAVLNLAANARDAMEPIGGPLLLETRRVCEGPGEAGGASWAELRLTDHGPGMDEDTRSRVFEPFFTTKALGRGTGLGLASVQATVHQAQGRIEVESTLGLGTSFVLRFPLTAEQPEMGLEQDQEKDLRGSETVLLVEDDTAIRRLITASLQSYGYSVVSVGDGPAALQAFGDGRGFDLLVTDFRLPGWDGHTVAKLLRAKKPELQVLYVSGLGDAALPPNGPETAERNLLQKPFVPRSLARKVRRLLDGEKGGSGHG